MDPARLTNPVLSDLDDEELASIAAIAAEVSVSEGKRRENA